MRIVSNEFTVHTEGYTFAKDRGAVTRRSNINFEHVKEPVTVPRPRIEDFNELVVVHDKMEYYS